MGGHHQAEAVLRPVINNRFKITVLAFYASIIAGGVIFREPLSQFIDNNMQRSAAVHEKRKQRISEELERMRLRKQEWEIYSQRPYEGTSSKMSASHTNDMSKHLIRNDWKDLQQQQTK